MPYPSESASCILQNKSDSNVSRMNYWWEFMSAWDGVMETWPLFSGSNQVTRWIGWPEAPFHVTSVSLEAWNQVLGTFMLVLLHVELLWSQFFSCLYMNIFLLMIEVVMELIILLNTLFNLLIFFFFFCSLWMNQFKNSWFHYCFCSTVHVLLSWLCVSAVVSTFFRDFSCLILDWILLVNSQSSQNHSCCYIQSHSHGNVGQAQRFVLKLDWVCSMQPVWPAVLPTVCLEVNRKSRHPCLFVSSGCSSAQWKKALHYDLQ